MESANLLCHGCVLTDLLGTSGASEWLQARESHSALSVLCQQAKEARQRGDTVAAHDKLIRALSLDPQNAGALTEDGLLKLWEGDEAGAATSFKAALHSDPIYAGALSGLALVRERLDATDLLD